MFTKSFTTQYVVLVEIVNNMNWTIDIDQIIKLRILVLYALVYMQLKIHIYNTASDEHNPNNPNLHYLYKKVKVYWMIMNWHLQVETGYFAQSYLASYIWSYIHCIGPLSTVPLQLCLS